ncbi:hypothetical protein MASR2M15_10700 [Anaerolineales bacterium]
MFIDQNKAYDLYILEVQRGNHYSVADVLSKFQKDLPEGEALHYTLRLPSIPIRAVTYEVAKIMEVALEMAGAIVAVSPSEAKTKDEV